MDTCECYGVYAENQLLDVVQCDECRTEEDPRWEVLLLRDSVTESRSLVPDGEDARAMALLWESGGEGFASIVYDPKGRRHRFHEGN